MCRLSWFMLGSLWLVLLEFLLLMWVNQKYQYNTYNFIFYISHLYFNSVLHCLLDTVINYSLSLSLGFPVELVLSLLLQLFRVTGIIDLPVWYETGATRFSFASTRTLFIIQLILMGLEHFYRLYSLESLICWHLSRLNQIKIIWSLFVVLFSQLFYFSQICRNQKVHGLH